MMIGTPIGWGELRQQRGEVFLEDGALRCWPNDVVLHSVYMKVKAAHLLQPIQNLGQTIPVPALATPIIILVQKLGVVGYKALLSYGNCPIHISCVSRIRVEGYKQVAVAL